MRVEAKLEELGLDLPEPAKLPRGCGRRSAGCGPTKTASTSRGTALSPRTARPTVLSVLSSLKRELGDLDRVSAWLMVHAMVNDVPGFAQTTNVVNGFSDPILELHGSETGMHARMAPGVAALPLGLPVVVGAEVAISV